jgi:signal transduction histidine kinase
LELSAAANKIAQGKFNVHIEPKSQDEVGLLYRDLMRMEGQLREYYKGLESEVRKKEKELEESRVLDKRKDDFISIASHELKTPITSMKIFTELLKRQSDVGQDERSVNYLNRIDDQINRLISLVNQLLDVSKIRAGGLKLRKSKFYIDRLVKETVDELEENMPKHKVIIKSLQRYKVSADKDRIQQVLINLLINAAKYSPNADKIIVSGKLKGKRNVVVSVKDFGMGIAPENQGKIFEKFFRIYEDKDKTFPGLGMGLHIASNIIKKHNGKIWFESEPHKGSTFYFSLPIFIEEENIRRKYGQKNTYN